MNRDTTMLDLVCAVSRNAGTDAEVVQRVATLVNSGRFRLNGSFRDNRFDQELTAPIKAGARRRVR